MTDTKRCDIFIAGFVAGYKAAKGELSPPEKDGWYVKDFADGWIHFANEYEYEARQHALETGATIRRVCSKPDEEPSKHAPIIDHKPTQLQAWQTFLESKGSSSR